MQGAIADGQLGVQETWLPSEACSQRGDISHAHVHTHQETAQVPVPCV